MNPKNMEPLGITKADELSFYDGESPRGTKCTSSSPNNYSSYIIRKKRIQDLDRNSLNFRRWGTSNNSTLRQLDSYTSSSGSVSVDSLESQDDGFLETIADFEPIDENVPQRLKNVFTGVITTTTKNVNGNLSPQDVSINNSPSVYFHRALSLQHTGYIRPGKKCLFQEENMSNSERTCESDRSPFKRAFSASEESIKSAVEKSEEEELIGDFSRTYSLPLTQGKHQDLKSITSHTLAKLLKGDFDNVVASYKVIDCRYPYEFIGGHIEGAINIYTKDQCSKMLNDQKITPCSNKIHILIFHCEFSSERGPTLCRYLRQQDRTRNMSSYPALQYPEIYLLEGGYKSFFTEYSTMCTPVAYKQMLHPEHEEDLRYFRSKSKSCDLHFRQKTHSGNLKRLRLKIAEEHIDEP